MLVQFVERVGHPDGLTVDRIEPSRGDEPVNIRALRKPDKATLGGVMASSSDRVVLSAQSRLQWAQPAAEDQW